jgi:hypothetical protein
MKTALLAFMLTVTAHMHVTVTALGTPVSVPVPWLILAAEVLAVTGTAWLAVRAVRGFRSSPYLRAAWPAGATP